MKKVFISFLIMTVMLTNISLVNISSVQAASNKSTIEVSLDNIKEIMTENNLDMKVLDNNLEIAKENYKSQKETVEDNEDAVDDAEEDVTTAESALASANSATVIDATAVASAQSSKDTADASVTTAEAQLASSKTTLEGLKYTLRTSKLQYEQKVEALVYSAQQEYIAYLSALDDEKLQEETVTSKTKVEQVAKLKYENGFISKNEYITSTEDNTDEVNTLNKLKDAEALAKTNLYTTLGISSGETVTFDTDIKDDFAKIAKINYNDDLEKMLDNNLDIQIDNITIDKLDEEDDDSDDDSDYTDDIDEYTMDNAEISVKQQMNTTEADFKAQYNTLINSYNAIKSSNNKLTQDGTVDTIMGAKYDYGFVSKKEVEDSKLALDTTSSTYKADKNTFYVNYLRYLQMKEGY